YHVILFFFSSRRRHTRSKRDWSSDVCSSDLYAPEHIEDYYFTPSDLGYGRNIRFDHDFVGRGALEQQAHRPARKKVTLVWEAAKIGRASCRETVKIQVDSGT